jgi:ribonuclease-3 family protein
MSDALAALRDRSVRTLAWLGDAEFERELRWRISARGDHPIDRLDRARARIARAEGQAALLAVIEPALRESELSVVRRARNAAGRSTGRGRRDVKAYRAATALEALVAHWAIDGAGSRGRFAAVLAGPLERAIDDALSTSRRPRRG